MPYDKVGLFGAFVQIFFEWQQVPICLGEVKRNNSPRQTVKSKGQIFFYIGWDVSAVVMYI